LPTRLPTEHGKRSSSRKVLEDTNVIISHAQPRVFQKLFPNPRVVVYGLATPSDLAGAGTLLETLLSANACIIHN